MRELTDLRNQGKDVILVSSGAIMVGKDTSPGGKAVPPLAEAGLRFIGQAKLMMIYQKLFSEYNQVASQVLMTKFTMTNDLNRRNARILFMNFSTWVQFPL